MQPRHSSVHPRRSVVEGFQLSAARSSPLAALVKNRFELSLNKREEVGSRASA